MPAQWQQAAQSNFEQSGEKVRQFYALSYAAKSWRRSRKVIAKIEYTSKGSNPRYIVTNLTGEPQFLYDKCYCARGDIENRIKEQQLALFADRTSCHDWWANQFRLLMSSLAYILLETIRRVALKDTELAQAYVNTLRLKLNQNRCCDFAQYPPNSFAAHKQLPIPETLLSCCGQTDTRIARFDISS
ncbi:Transposase DDE domain group 1 [Nitrosomonas halophila]|uniref:Transposase DDE domain group 1 n=1 Tax=Nitrosomonas halophila TaxID=44576 RepID=A0A1H3H4Q7_9PROT|nr:Transposase DDE domain group 1 [Nitrosomonas halophila]